MVGAVLPWQIYTRSNRTNQTPETHPHIVHNNDLFPLPSHYVLRQQTRDRRAMYVTWLRRVFTMILPQGPDLTRLITPNSPRAGWATDRSRQNSPTTTLMDDEGRWSDPRAVVAQYIRTCLLPTWPHPNRHVQNSLPRLPHTLQPIDITSDTHTNLQK